MLTAANSISSPGLPPEFQIHLPINPWKSAVHLPQTYYACSSLRPVHPQLCPSELTCGSPNPFPCPLGTQLGHVPPPPAPAVTCGHMNRQKRRHSFQTCGTETHHLTDPPPAQGDLGKYKLEMTQLLSVKSLISPHSPCAN